MNNTNNIAQQTAFVALAALCSSMLDYINEPNDKIDEFNFDELIEIYITVKAKIPHDKLIFLIAKIYQSTYDYFVLTTSNIDNETMTAFATGLYKYLDVVECTELNI